MHVVANGQRQQDMSVVLSSPSPCLASGIYFWSEEHVDNSWLNADAQQVWKLSPIGNKSIAAGGKRVSPSFMVSNNFEQIWKQFEEHHCLVSTTKTFGNGFYGAAAVNLGKRERLLWFWGGSIPTEISRVWFTHYQLSLRIMFKTHHNKEIVNLYRVDPNETISTAKYENSCLGRRYWIDTCSIDEGLMKPFNCLDQKKSSWSLTFSTGGRVEIKGRWYLHPFLEELDDDGINCFIRWRALRNRIRNEGVADVSRAKFAGRFGGLLARAKTIPMTDSKSP